MTSVIDNFHHEKRKFQILILDAVFHLWRDRMTFDWMSKFFFYPFWLVETSVRQILSQSRKRSRLSYKRRFLSLVTLFGFELLYDWLVWLSGHALIGQDRFLASVLTSLDRRSSALTFLLCNESWTTEKTTLKLFQEMPKYLSKRSTTRESEQILSRWWFCREEFYRLLSQEKKNFYLIVGQVKLEDCVHWIIVRGYQS